MNPRFLFSDVSADTGGAAPASAPAESPSGGEAPTQISRIPDSPDEPSHDNLAGMENDDFDLVEVPVEPEGGEPAGDQPPQQPQAPKPAATPTAPVEPQQAPPQAAAPAQNASSTPRSPLDQAIDGFRTNHNDLSNWASKNLFVLTPEDVEKMDTDVNAHIPVLMGRVYSQAIQATVNLIKNFVPEMVNSGVATTTARAARASEALQEFYTANPNLNPQQHGALVDKWARSFRAANPQASRADAIKFVGNAVSAELGISPSAQNGRAPRAAPFAPARPGTRVQTPTPHRDPYEGMDMDFDEN